MGQEGLECPTEGWRGSGGSGEHWAVSVGTQGRAPLCTAEGRWQIRSRLFLSSHCCFVPREKYFTCYFWESGITNGLNKQISRTVRCKIEALCCYSRAPSQSRITSMCLFAASPVLPVVPPGLAALGCQQRAPAPLVPISAGNSCSGYPSQKQKVLMGVK